MQTKIKAGQSWKSRSGETFTIISFVGTKEHPIVAINNKKVLYEFTENGRFYNDSNQHNLDLIELL